MSDDDLIRRGDAIVAVHVECECGCDLCGGCAPSNCICDDIADPYHDAESRIRALPAAPRPVEAAAVRLAEAEALRPHLVSALCLLRQALPIIKPDAPLRVYANDHVRDLIAAHIPLIEAALGDA